MMLWLGYKMYSLDLKKKNREKEKGAGQILKL